jgi:hypothetical protein
LTTAAPDNHALEYGFANQAWFAFPTVNPVLQLEKPLFAIGVNVIRNRGATQGNCLPQHFLNGLVKPSQVLMRKRRCPPPRPNTCPKQ